jgi:hypothetical protein
MNIERDENGMLRFAERDGLKHYRMEFESEDGTVSGVEYIDNLNEVSQIVVGYGANEYRIETPKMYEDRMKEFLEVNAIIQDTKGKVLSICADLSTLSESEDIMEDYFEDDHQRGSSSGRSYAFLMARKMLVGNFNFEG